MRTFEDLTKASKLGDFCRQAVEEFMGTSDYHEALDGEAYYAKHNVTIEKFQKWLYTLSGRQVPDIYSANYKLKTLFFRRLCTQQIQYVLGNGLKLDNMKNKEKLGKDFDNKLQTAAKRAMASGKAYGFWNYDHLEVFGVANTKADAGFCPIEDEKSGELMAGIRFWFKNVGDEVLSRYTLYEADGVTEFKRTGGGDVEVMKPKSGYIHRVKSTDALGIVEETYENYGKLPIVPLYSNDCHESELNGVRESIDCYDFVKSGLANDIDDSSAFYWVLKNEGGMDDVDLAKFLQRIKSVHAAMVEDGTEAEPHTLNIPTEARVAMLEILRKDIYEDFQSLDVNTLSAAAKTTQEIQAAYQAQDNKCAEFEYFVLDFVQKILELAGIDDNPTFTWNRVVNQKEQTDMVLSAAQYISDDCIIKHLPFLTPEEIAEELELRKADEFKRFSAPPEEDEEEDK